MKFELKDFLSDINHKKENLMDLYPDSVEHYPPYIVNRCLSGFVDTILYSNLMNVNNHIDKKLQYDFYINSIRSKKRFSPWLKKERLDDLDLIKQYYNYSDEKARIALKILSLEQIDYIRSKMTTGGPYE